jgi:hypothetical protein
VFAAALSRTVSLTYAAARNLHMPLNACLHACYLVCRFFSLSDRCFCGFAAPDVIGPALLVASKLSSSSPEQFRPPYAILQTLAALDASLASQAPAAPFPALGSRAAQVRTRRLFENELVLLAALGFDVAPPIFPHCTAIGLLARLPDEALPPQLPRADLTCRAVSVASCSFKTPAVLATAPNLWAAACLTLAAFPRCQGLAPPATFRAPLATAASFSEAEIAAACDLLSPALSCSGSAPAPGFAGLTPAGLARELNLPAAGCSDHEPSFQRAGEKRRAALQPLPLFTDDASPGTASSRGSS